MAIPRPPPPPLPAQRPPSASAAAVSAAAATAVVSNGIRLAGVVEKLSAHFQGSKSLSTSDLFQLCYALARGIDFALSSNDIPAVASRIPAIIKKACQQMNEPSLHSSLMVLMISSKNACKNNWFQEFDREEILSRANELSSSFCMSTGPTADAGNSVDIISKIMPRYYPQLKFSRLIVSFEAKAGYDILMSDFFIERNLPPTDKIRLFVIQTDNLETSACIASPPQASFLVNGKGVDRRNNFSMDTGPQFPTDITKMLKYGTNIIQAVGYFKGNYLIAIAFVSKLICVDAPALEDYVEPVNDGVDSDSEIIEGPATVSLNCPISFKRIKTPVKGHRCKHHQCFDYDNYMQMNSRKPTWRCPCCNTTACSLDLRLDQKMVKILKEMDEDTINIVIFADGSWKKFEHENDKDKTDEATVENIVDGGNNNNNDGDTVMRDVVDLTTEQFGESEEGDAAIEIEDNKPDIEFTLSELAPGPPPSANPTSAALIPQANLFHSGDDNAWLRNSFSPGSGMLESLVPDSLLNPIASDSNSPSYLQLQQQLNTEHARRHQAIPRNVTRVPIAVQALPVPLENPSTSSSSRRVVNGLPNHTDGSLLQLRAPSLDGIVSANADLVSLLASQNRDGQENQTTSSSLPFSQGVALPSQNVPASRSPLTPAQHLSGPHAYRVSPLHAPTSQPATSMPLSRAPPHLRVSQMTQRPQQPVPPLRSIPVASGSVPQQARLESLASEPPSEMGWRPTGRMRGSLTGDAYSAALNQYLVPPTQIPTETPRQNPNPNNPISGGSSVPGIPPYGSYR